MCRNLLISVCLSLAACVSRSEMYPEEGNGSSPGLVPVSVRYLKTLYTGYATAVQADVEIRGRVTANDRYGTFPNTLWVEDGTGGISLKISGDDLFLDYPAGSEVSVRCRGLVLGGYGGEVSLGTASGRPDYQNGFIPREAVNAYVRTYEGIKEVYPADLLIREATPVWVGAYVAFERLQFVDEELSLAWCEPGADTDRHLVDARGDTLVVRTGRHADFADRLLPQGSGHIEGILGYFNGRYQLRVVTHAGALMDAPRFQPVAVP